MFPYFEQLFEVTMVLVAIVSSISLFFCVKMVITFGNDYVEVSGQDTEPDDSNVEDLTVPGEGGLECEACRRHRRNQRRGKVRRSQYLHPNHVTITVPCETCNCVHVFVEQRDIPALTRSSLP
ncbi:unnamed protein product, partial [Mesorhabditis spiculigera]